MITPASPSPPGIVTPRPMDMPPRGRIPPPRASITSELRPPPRRQRTSGYLPRAAPVDALAGVQHRQDVPRRVLEPGDGGALVARDPLLVLVEALVALHLDAARAELVDRGVHVLDLEVEDRVAGRREVGLRVDHGRPIAGQLEGQDAHRAVRDVKAQGLPIEPPGLVDVIDGEAAECGCIGEHVYLDPADGRDSSVRRSGSPKFSNAAYRRAGSICSSGQRA